LYRSPLTAVLLLVQLEGKPMRVSGLSKSSGKADKHESKPVVSYNADADSTLTPAKGEKRKATDDGMP
jgi:hypothetical protein